MTGSTPVILSGAKNLLSLRLNLLTDKQEILRSAQNDETKSYDWAAITAGGVLDATAHTTSRDCYVLIAR